MPKNKKKQSARASTELDGVYVLKLVLYVFVGSFWLKITTASGEQLPVPLGLGIGILFASHEHFQIDRKIEYAVLIVATLVGYLAPYGLFIAF